MQTNELLTKAGSLLLAASQMLRMEAYEWRERKNSVPRSWEGGMSEWSAKCARIANINDDAATKMQAMVEQITERVSAEAA